MEQASGRKGEGLNELVGDQVTDIVPGLPRDCRRSVRFSVMLRVGYVVDDRSTFSFTADVSGTGVWLRNPKGIEEGQELPLTLNLSGGQPPVELWATVRRLIADGPEAGAGLEFLPDQEEPLSQLREFIEQELVAKVEERTTRSLRSLQPVFQLSAY